MASQCPTSECKEISLLLLGKTGHGKSATGNTILGRKAFAKSDIPNSITVTAKLNCSKREDGTVVRVVDTPGVMDTEKKKDKILPKICDAMSWCPQGFNALICVVKFGIRYTKEETESLGILKEYFGSRFLKDYGVVVMTQGDSFDVNHEKDKMTFKEWLERLDKKVHDEYFVQLLQECNNRCVLFYNVGEEYEETRKDCVTNLLNIIQDEMRTPFTSEHIKLAKGIREKEILKLGTPILHTAIQEKLSLLIDQIHRDMKNDTLSFEAMLETLNELEREVDNVREKFKEHSYFESLKENVEDVKKIIIYLSSLEEREKQIESLEQVLMDLEHLKEVPDNILIFLARAFHIFAKGINKIGIIFRSGIKREFLEDLETISEMMLKDSSENFNKNNNKYEEAKNNRQKRCAFL